MLTPKQARFVEEYLIDLNATQAAIRAGYSAKTAEVQGSRLLSNAKVQSAIQAALAKRSARTEITQDHVLQELWAIATADPNELIEFRRTCCRYCWGLEHGYQETAAERLDRRTAYDVALVSHPARALSPVQPFAERGGIGFVANADPKPDCPECRGQGVGGAFIKDTRALAPGARALYAGVKETKDGLQVLMHDKVGALTLVARHLGMLSDKIRLVGGQPGDPPVKTETTHILDVGNLTDEQLAALASIRVGPDTG